MTFEANPCATHRLPDAIVSSTGSLFLFCISCSSVPLIEKTFFSQQLCCFFLYLISFFFLDPDDRCLLVARVVSRLVLANLLAYVTSRSQIYRNGRMSTHGVCSAQKLSFSGHAIKMRFSTTERTNERTNEGLAIQLKALSSSYCRRPTALL